MNFTANADLLLSVIVFLVCRLFRPKNLHSIADLVSFGIMILQLVHHLFLPTLLQILTLLLSAIVLPQLVGISRRSLFSNADHVSSGRASTASTSTLPMSFAASTDTVIVLP
jgi:hypothetical protein